MSALAPLWEIESELVALLDSVDVCDPELRLELEQRIAEHVSAEVEKLDRISHVFSMLEAQEAAAKSEIERLRERQQAAARAADRLSQSVLRVLRMRDGKPLKGKLATFFIRKSEGVVIVDPQQVPEQFRRTTVTVDHPKDAIRRAIKEGQEVPGVVLEQREHLARK